MFLPLKKFIILFSIYSVTVISNCSNWCCKIQIHRIVLLLWTQNICLLSHLRNFLEEQNTFLPLYVSLHHSLYKVTHSNHVLAKLPTSEKHLCHELLRSPWCEVFHCHRPEQGGHELRGRGSLFTPAPPRGEGKKEDKGERLTNWIYKVLLITLLILIISIIREIMQNAQNRHWVSRSQTLLGSTRKSRTGFGSRQELDSGMHGSEPGSGSQAGQRAGSSSEGTHGQREWDRRDGPALNWVWCACWSVSGHLSCPPLPANRTLCDSSLAEPKRSVSDIGCYSNNYKQGPFAICIHIYRHTYIWLGYDSCFYTKSSLEFISSQLWVSSVTVLFPGRRDGTSVWFMSKDCRLEMSISRKLQDATWQS